jgi:hypothetical protein
MRIKKNAGLDETSALRVKGPFCLLAALFFFLSAGPCPALQEPKPKTPPKSVLTDEEKEILKNREILENLDLLQDFEKFQFWNYFAAEESGDKPEAANKRSTKKEVPKEEKKKK